MRTADAASFGSACVLAAVAVGSSMAAECSRRQHSFASDTLVSFRPAYWLSSVGVGFAVAAACSYLASTRPHPLNR